MPLTAELHLLFGKKPEVADNLKIVGAFAGRIEEWNWPTVWPASGLLRGNDGAIEIETIWIADNLKQCGDYHSKWSLLPRERKGRHFNLSLFWSFGYYHWICDVLARLHTVLPLLKPDIQVILPPQLKTWQTRSLELIGLPHCQCVQYSGKRPWKVESLLYVSPVTMTGDHEPESLHWVRDTIWSRCLGGPPARAGWRKLYLTRKNTWSRNVVNETDLLPALLQRGFEVVDCGTLAFDEQVRLFSEAACVAGPHGAAFTNILWSPPGLRVFEVFEPQAVRRCYWSMSQTLGHSHQCGVGECVQNPGGEPNILVQKDQFNAALGIMLDAS